MEQEFNKYWKSNLDFCATLITSDLEELIKIRNLCRAAYLEGRKDCLIKMNEEIKKREKETKRLLSLPD